MASIKGKATKPIVVGGKPLPTIDITKWFTPKEKVESTLVPTTEVFEVTPDIQTIKEKVNLDLEMGDINLIGDKRVTTADTWLPEDISPKKKHFIDFFSQEGLDLTAPQNYAKERIEAHKIDENQGWAASKNPKKGQYWQNAMSQMGKIALEFPDHPASINYNKLAKEAIKESGRVTAENLTLAQRQEAQAKSAEVQRLNRVEDYENLYNTMLDNHLTIGQAVTGAYKAEHGKDIPKATKHDQVIGAFYRIENTFKDQNPELHKFFENEIKAYQIGEATNRQLKYGTKEYELARIELADELGIDVRNIDRAHALMKPRLAQLYNLLQEGLITRKDYERLQRPSFFLLHKQNIRHRDLETNLFQLLESKKFLTDQKDTVGINKRQAAIDGVIKEMDAIGVKSEMWDPLNKLLTVFGREPTKAELKKLIKEQELTYKNKGGYIPSSLVSVDEVLNGIY